MNQFYLEEWKGDGLKCAFYSVRFLDDEEDETTKFFYKYISNSKYEEEAQKLLDFVADIIGNRHGPIEPLFNRLEDEVIGLPNKGEYGIYHFPRFPLRLYALKLSEKIVVLFTGGIKDSGTNQKSSLSGNWYLSCQFATVILDAIRDGMIVIDDSSRTITMFNGDHEIILP